MDDSTQLNLNEIKSWTAYRLAVEAASPSPDSPTSPGAQMLMSVRGAFVEHVEWLDSQGDLPAVEDMGTLDGGGSLHQIADDAPSVGTHEKWAQFVDLAAYSEDVAEYTNFAEAADMDRLASVALYLIAERLCCAMVAEMRAENDNDGEA